MNNIAASIAVYVRIAHKALDVLEVATHLDTATTVRVLTRLDNPQRLAELGHLIEDSFLGRISHVVEQLLELGELGVARESFLDVEREWHAFVIVQSERLVVHLHVVEDGLLVAQMVVVLHLAVVTVAM